MNRKLGPTVHISYDPIVLRTFIEAYLKLSAQRIEDNPFVGQPLLESFKNWLVGTELIAHGEVHARWDDCEDENDWGISIEVAPYKHLELRWKYQIFWDNHHRKLRVERIATATDPGSGELYAVPVGRTETIALGPPIPVIRWTKSARGED